LRYSTVFKFVAFVLCAATLLGAVGSATALVFLTELGGKSVNEHYVDQLHSRALSYGLQAMEIHASEKLGGAPRNLINRYYGNDWETRYFDWTRVGYTLYDSEGNAVQEHPMPDDSIGVAHEFDLAVGGQYMKVISTAPYEEYYPQETVPAPTEGTQVVVMPGQGSTAVHSVYVDYTDGHREEWPYDGTQLGALSYDGGSTVTFFSNVGELPMGDGWCPNHILFADSVGNIVYEAYDDTAVYLGGGLDDDGRILWYLPAGTVTTAAPVGMTFTSGEYTAYDAIPTQGVTVTSMNVSYGNRAEGTIGSEGISSPDLIGTLFHDHRGNAEFHSTEPMTMDIPENFVITHITFADAQQNCIFEASCPDGVGSLINDENGYLVFRGTMPGTEVPEDATPEETAEATEASEIPEETAKVTGFATEELTVYAAPSSLSKQLGKMEAWEEMILLRQDQFNGETWGLTETGWVRMEQVLVGDGNAAAKAAPAALLPDDAAADATLPDETIPAETAPKETIPEETVIAVTEPEIRSVPEQTDIAAEPAAAAEAMAEESMPTEPKAYPEEDVEIFLYYDGQDMIAEYVWESIPEGYTMNIQLAKGALRNELGWTLLRLAEAFRSILLEILGICIAVFVLCVVHLSCSAGRTRRSDEVRAGGLNRIPLDLYLGGGAFAEAGLVALAIYGSQYFARNDEQLAIIFCGACAYLASLLIVGFFFALVAQIKTPGGFWWRNSLCGWCIRLMILGFTGVFDLCIKGWVNGKPLAGRASGWLGRSCRGLWVFTKKTVLWLWDTAKRLCIWSGIMIRRGFSWSTGKLARFFGMLPITWQFLTTGFTLVFLLYVMMRTYKVGYILLGFGIFFAVILYAASAFAILLENAKRMSRGDLDTKVDDRMLIGGFKEFAGELNDLAGVAVVAAQKQLKSERMKTELITNVSHDIKTPLTSIINYVDLLQKPHTPEQQVQYLDVLDRQSQRLKKLVDDLMEMSKASTGNMAVDIERVDAAEAVNQALGEFADKLERAQLLPVFRQPEEQVYMMADGRLVWRVMSNLLGNAVKYALPGTRVYLDLLEMDGKVIISMKNISREELNVNADELMERFVRGDASRNTEGSGLGLNIAQSLMELQRGQLQILVDGDLFKVTMIFPGA